MEQNPEHVIERIAPAYDTKVHKFRLRQDWGGLIHFCLTLEKSIQEALKDDSKEQGELERFYAALLTELSLAYRMVDKPLLAVRAAEKSLRVHRKTDPSPIDLHFSYKLLARALENAGKAEEAKTMLVRSITCLFTSRESEFLAVGIDGLAELVMSQEQLEASTAFVSLSSAIRRQSRWAHRAFTHPEVPGPVAE